MLGYGKQGRRSSGREGGAEKGLRVMETYKKNCFQFACFCSASSLTSKVITEILENHSEFSGYANNCNYCFNLILT